MNTARQYFKPAQDSWCECSNEIEALEKELAKSKEHTASTFFPNDVWKQAGIVLQRASQSGQPSNLEAWASTWSDYKHNNAVEVLIGIIPQGVVSFVFNCWEGQVSNKYLTDHLWTLKQVGDVILADRGFDIAELVGLKQASLHIPAFTRGKQQLSALEIGDARQITNVNIHFERVINCVIKAEICYFTEHWTN